MGLRKPSVQHAEIGNVATRMLWIPAVATVLVVGYFVLRTQGDHDAAATAIVTAHAATPDLRRAPSPDTVRQLPEATLVTTRRSGDGAPTARPGRSRPRCRALNRPCPSDSRRWQRLQPWRSAAA